MGRRKSQYDSDNISFTVIEPTYRYLDELLATGLYGNNRSEVARSIVLNFLRKSIKDGDLDKRSPVYPQNDEE